MRLVPVDHHKEEVVGLEEEFIHGSFATGVALGNGFTATHAVGAIATADALHGEGLVTWTAAADEYCSYLSTWEIFQMLNGCPIRFKAILRPGLTASLPEELNLFVGCMENMDTASEFVAAGGGMRALCGDIFGFFTPESGGAVLDDSVWHCITGHNDLEQVDALNAANPNNLSGADVKVIDGTTGDGLTHEFVAEWVPTNVVPGVGGVAATIINAETRFWVDGVLVAKHQQRGTFQITIATAELMNFGFVGENITDIAVCNLLYLKCEQLRLRTW
ncbi:MAG: hypothetical protein V3U39_12390 [Acidimicrobiia bacterium]